MSIELLEALRQQNKILKKLKQITECGFVGDKLVHIHTCRCDDEYQESIDDRLSGGEEL